MGNISRRYKQGVFKIPKDTGTMSASICLICGSKSQNLQSVLGARAWEARKTQRAATLLLAPTQQEAKGDENGSWEPPVHPKGRVPGSLTYALFGSCTWLTGSCEAESLGWGFMFCVPNPLQRDTSLGKVTSVKGLVLVLRVKSFHQMSLQMSWSMEMAEDSHPSQLHSAIPVKPRGRHGDTMHSVSACSVASPMSSGSSPNCSISDPAPS